MFTFPDSRTLNYVNNEPFPHCVLKDSWDISVLRDCSDEIGKFSNWDGEKNFYGSKKKRFCSDIDNLPKSISSVIQKASTPVFLDWLSHLTGEQHLIPDPYLEGGGIHQSINGAFLKVHADFNWSKKLNLFRRLNVLIYLNEQWEDEWGGHLELWDSDMSNCVQKIKPEMNTMVIFTTDDISFHGHPHPTTSPKGVFRNSIALYYYTPIEPQKNFQEARLITNYRPTAGEEFVVEKTISKRIRNKFKRMFQ